MQCRGYVLLCSMSEGYYPRSMSLPYTDPLLAALYSTNFSLHNTYPPFLYAKASDPVATALLFDRSHPPQPHPSPLCEPHFNIYMSIVSTSPIVFSASDYYSSARRSLRPAVVSIVCPLSPVPPSAPLLSMAAAAPPPNLICAYIYSHATGKHSEPTSTITSHSRSLMVAPCTRPPARLMAWAPHGTRTGSVTIQVLLRGLEAGQPLLHGLDG